MVKYLITNNITGFLFLLYRNFPEHPFLDIRPKRDWCKTDVFMTSEEFSKCSFNEKLCFKGIVKYPEYSTTKNDILLSTDLSSFIQGSILLCKFSCDIFQIFPSLKSFKINEDDLGSILDSYIFEVDKPFPLFSKEEWENFIKEGIEKNFLCYTDDV